MPPKTREMVREPTTQSIPYEHPVAMHAKNKRNPGPYAIQPITVFYLFLAAGLFAAVFAPILDCDETFNYWEPTHYLSHGYGLQTWEYAPEYAIRTWLYVGLHAVVGNVRRLLPQSSKLSEFYFIRYALAVVCALSQTIFFKALSVTLNGRVGFFFLLITVTSPANFHASTAFLPSSFAMYTCMLGGAAFLNWRGGIKSSQGIFWFALGGVLGWPFAAALCLPFVLEDVVLSLLGGKEARLESAFRIFRGVVAGVIIVFLDFLVNLFFYKRITIVSWNIIKYNLFSSTGGPELYGTEPWTFYLWNLALNFNLCFLLALAAFPLFLLQKLLSLSGHGLQSDLRTLVFMSPFYMWLAIFTAQRHKEERFMYPAYPFLALNASMSLHILLAAIGSSDPRRLAGKLPARLKLVMVSCALLVALTTSLARVLGVLTAYTAPMSILRPLWTGGADGSYLGDANDMVCYGKDWYRFPSSYFLPQAVHAKFVRSAFRGLLPGDFSEAKTGFGFWSDTWLPTSGLNDRNEEDVGKHVLLGACAFLVDTQFPERQSAPSSPDEPDYAADTASWEVVRCERILDPASTHTLARTLWVPDFQRMPSQLRRRWGRHCLLRRKR